jgi:S-ribosylhomocysteine lyase LuxS involved in autoinducer biosynthesis
MTADTVNILIFQEHGSWVAHCVEYDIRATGPDIETVKTRMLDTLEHEARESIRRNGALFAGIDPAPYSIREKMKHCGQASVSVGSAAIYDGTRHDIGYRMALCA